MTTEVKPADQQGPAYWLGQHEGRLQTLLAGADLAAAVTLRYFGESGIAVEAKADASPVTIADRTAEWEFRQFIEQVFPNDGVLGEEHGERIGTSGYRWVIDPIDGTKSFVAGVPLYSTLLALEYDGEPVAGGIWIPALGEAVVASAGLGCWHRRGRSAASEPSDAQWRRAQWCRAAVTEKSQLEQAIFVTTAVDSYEEVGAMGAFADLQRAAWFTRTWGDGYGYLLVATGRADVMVDPIVNPWDIAAIKPVIEEAGGRFTNWEGVATAKSRNAIGSNGRIHDRILAMLR
jgi:histidinol phosphatase-like enzyme (inositol monophosphatase family)